MRVFLLVRRGDGNILVSFLSDECGEIYECLYINRELVCMGEFCFCADDIGFGEKETLFTFWGGGEGLCP